jgi:tetratricopeptide (TPR) repeat protein/tRNA A-37 threonylcarbamoyl transferase component Bud32
MFQHTIAGLPTPAVSLPHGLSGSSEAEPHSAAPRREGATIRLLPGSIVPGTRYRLRNWIGDGGMGVVYEAEHIDLERPVALKILRAQIADREEERERFRQEARMTTRIVSPNVVQVLDFGLLRDGRVFYAMELLRGRPLSFEIARGPIAPARAIGLLRQMCAGLAAAHESGVIHRDVKPDNAMVCDHSGRSCVKLLDFGIASPVSDATTRRASGTPEYMSPEQIEGLPFDVRLDIYALGCTAYEMLTGQPPFCRESTLEVVRAHLEDAPLPLTRAAAKPEIPTALEQVVMRCIAKRPEDRYPSMADLEAALCEAQIAAGLHTDWDDLPLPAVSPERRERLEARMPRPRTSRGRRRRWVVLASGALAIATALVWFPSSSVGAADHERVEQLVGTARAAATRGAYVYPLQGEPNETAYTTVVTLENIDGPAASLADQAAGALRRSLADELVALGDGYWNDPDARPYARDYYAQAVLFDPQSAYARGRAGFTPGELSDLRVRAETQDFSEPELLAAEPLVALAVVDEQERAAALSEVVADPPAQSMTRHRRMRTLAREDRPDERSKPVEVARMPVTVPVFTTADAAVSPSKPSRLQKASARTMARKGQRVFAHGQRDEAASLFQRALAIDPGNATAMRGLSDVHFDRGEHERALHFARRATQIEPSNGNGYIRLGDAWFRLLDYSAARRAYRRALALGRSDADERLRRLDQVAPQ